jgi:hypothetical protein
VLTSWTAWLLIAALYAGGAVALFLTNGSWLGALIGLPLLFAMVVLVVRELWTSL